VTNVLRLQVARDEEFSPVKNAPGSSSDSPDTARAQVLALHKRWVEAAGGRVVEQEGKGAQGVEISPLLSYGGEGLAELVGGRTSLSSTELK
jgi:UDP-N-acetylglucosamine/UDP-N-acetylgalactosamine diphosphorylase